MADTSNSGTTAGNAPARPSAATPIPSDPDLHCPGGQPLPVDTLRRGLALLLSTIALDLDNLRDLVRQAEPGDPSVHAVLGDLLAVSAWRCDVGARQADPSTPLRRTDAEHFLEPELLHALGLGHA